MIMGCPPMWNHGGHPMMDATLTRGFVNVLFAVFYVVALLKKLGGWKLLQVPDKGCKKWDSEVN